MSENVEFIGVHCCFVSTPCFDGYVMYGHFYIKSYLIIDMEFNILCFPYCIVQSKCKQHKSFLNSYY